MGLDAFAEDFKTTAVCKELPASAPGELPALSSQLGTARRTLSACCCASSAELASTCRNGVLSIFCPALDTHRCLL